MKRSMAKAIEDYMKLTDKNDGTRSQNKYVFYASDLQQLVDMSHDKYDAIFKATMAAFMVGYRAGRRDQKEGR